MEEPRRAARSVLLLLAIGAVLTACATVDPLSQLIADEEEEGACMELSQKRLAVALDGTDLPVDLYAAMQIVIDDLPEVEKSAVSRAGEFFVAEHGASELPRGGEIERNAYWSALYDGFRGADICTLSRSSMRNYDMADIFVNMLDARLREGGVETGSPNFAHTDLVVALLRTAAGLGSAGSLSPTPAERLDSRR